MKTIVKALVAAFAFAAMSEAAFAEETHAVDSRAVLEDVYAAIEETRPAAFDAVLARAEARMTERMAELNARDDEPAPSFLIASN